MKGFPMSNFDKLAALGAECVGGDVVYKHKLLGRVRNGDLQLTEDGLKMLDVEDVVVKEDKPKRTKAKAVVEAEPEVEIDVE
jgi:hypothetical protein